MCITLISSVAQSASLGDALEHLKKLNPEQYNGHDLEKLRQVDTIRLMSGKITDSDFIHLTPFCQLENIKKLDFRYNPQVTGAGLKAFAEVCGQWKSITHLELGGRLIDKHLVALNAFPNLEVLDIDFHDDDSKSQVTGEFFKSINLTKLEGIHAIHTNLSDENALLILNWPSLELFKFFGTPLSEEVLERLRNEKIDGHRLPWNLKRVQYEAKTPRTNKYITYEIALKCCKHALEKNIITQEAYDWAMARDLCLAAYFTGEHLVNYEFLKLPPKPRDDL